MLAEEEGINLDSGCGNWFHAPGDGRGRGVYASAIDALELVHQIHLSDSGPT